MNHFKTFIFFLFLMGYSNYQPLKAQLQRPLTPNEVHILNENVKKDPTNIKSRLFLGNHYYNQNNWKQVINFFAPVAEQLPDSDIYKLAYSFLNVDDFREAEAIGGILMSRSQVKVSSYLLAVEIYAKILDKTENPLIKKPVHAKLFETLKAVQTKDPENAKIYDIWLQKLEKYVEHYAFEALRVMEDMEKNNIKFYPRHISLKCRYNFLAKFTKAAKLTCNKAIIIEPENPRNYIYLGQTHVNIGEEKVGKRMLASVGKKFSESHEALFAAAESYKESGNITEAFMYYQKASKYKEATPETFMGLATTAFDLKKYGVALQAYNRHCYKENYLHHNFRRASGLLKEEPQWQELYRQRMIDCKPGSGTNKK